MTINNTERELLHYALDNLLNVRARLEQIDPSTLKPGSEFSNGYFIPRHQLFLQAAEFLRRAIGEKLHQSEMRLLFDLELEEDCEHTEIAATLANSIRSFLPLFMQKGSYEGFDFGKENIDQIISDLMGIYWGDAPRFFSISDKTQGSPKRPYRITKLRLAALNWDKHLAAVGVTTQERHGIIAAAFKTDWDTIRKWGKAIEDRWGFLPYPPSDIERAKTAYFDDPEAVLNAIKRDGHAYWIERKTKSSGKEN